MGGMGTMSAMGMQMLPIVQAKGATMCFMGA